VGIVASLAVATATAAATAASASLARGVVVKSTWRARLERGERAWIIFCTTMTLILGIAELLAGGHL